MRYLTINLRPCTITDKYLQRLKAALWYSIGKIVDEETLRLGVNATPQFIGALTEMVWAQIGTLSILLILELRSCADESFPD